MKKYKYFLIILFIVMVVPLIIQTFKRKHTVDYKIDKYTINENFYKKNNKNIYNIKISYKKTKISYKLENINIKQKKIIKDIKTYKSNNVICIIPTYKKNLKLEIYCTDNNQQVSNYYLQKNKDFNVIKKKVEKYKIDFPTTDNKKTNYRKIEVYKNNIMNDYTYIMWDYKGIYLLRNDELKYQKLLENDLYDNVSSTITDRYYIILDNRKASGIENIYYYDLKKEKTGKIKLKEKISKDSYINGNIKNKIYITDKNKKIQYEFNIKKEEIKEIGNEDINYIKYIDGEKHLLEKKEFFKKNQYFENDEITDKSISPSKITYNDNTYYYIEDDSFYRQYKKNNKELLFKLENIKEWFIYKENIVLICDDIIYTYNDMIGLRKIIENKELNYNYKNIK